MDAKQANGFTHGKPACTGPTQRRPLNFPSPQQGKSNCRSHVPHAKNRSVVAHSLVYQSSLRINGMQPTSPAAWEFVSTKLKESNVKVISQQELVFAKEKGAIIIDIRPAGEYESGHIKDSVNVSLFQLITGWDPVKALRRAGFAFFGVFNGTEVNPDFQDQIFQVTGEEVTSKDTPIVLLCQTGGSILPSSAYKNGKQSRSLMAAYEMLRLGYTNISVLKGGFSEWKRNERPYDVIE